MILIQRVSGRVLRWSSAICLLLLVSSTVPAQKPMLAKTLAIGAVPVHMAFSPDGKTLAAVGVSEKGDQSVLKLWDVATGKNTATRKFHKRIAWSVAFSPDGKTFVTAGGQFRNDREQGPDVGMGELKLWDATTCRNIATFLYPQGRMVTVAFSPDGKSLASCSEDGTVQVWNVATRKITTTCKYQPGFAEPGGFCCVMFSPDGKTLALGTGHVRKDGEGGGVTGEIQLWDLARGTRTARFQGHPGEGCFSNMNAVVYSLAFSPDGKTLISGGARTIELWDVATGKNRAIFQQPGGEVVWRVALSPDGKTLAWANGFVSVAEAVKWPSERGVRLLDVATGKNIAFLEGHPRGCWSVAFSPDGRTLATGGVEGTIRLWNLQPARR